MNMIDLPTQELKVYTGVAARILKLLVSGVTPVQAAKAVGVTDSYVSQLCAEPDFQAQIAEHIKKDVERAIAIDENYHDIELALSRKLKELIPFMHEPDKILRTLAFVNGSKKKTETINPATNEPSKQAQAVKLILPVVIQNQFVVNPNNEVVSVDDRELVTLNSASIDKLAAKHRKDVEEDMLAATKQLPATKNVHSKEDKWSNL